MHDAEDWPGSLLKCGPIQQNKEKTARASPIAYVTGKAPLFLICHGDVYPLVPHHQSELLVAALKRAGVPLTFHTGKGGGHGAFHDAKVSETTHEFPAKHLK